MTSRPAALGLAFAVVATVCGSAIASASTISGPLGGVTLPAKGKGVASVRAVSPKTFAVVADDRVSGGRFSLSVPAGAYFLLGTTSPFRGTAGVDRSIATVKVKAGARKSVRLSLKPRKAKRPKFRLPPIPGLPTARAAYVKVDYPAVWLKPYKVATADPQFNGLANGLPDMLTTDILRPLAAACKGRIVERRKLDIILAEQALSQSALADPSTRIEPGKIIAHNKEVTGRISGTEKDMTITSTVTDVASGRSRSVTHHGTHGFFPLERKIGPALVKLICGEKPPTRYLGTVEGSYGIPELTLRWSGNVRLKFDGFGPGGAGAPDGKYALYVVEGGSLHVTLDGLQDGCTIHGEGDFPLTGIAGQWTTLQQDVDERAYTVFASFANGTDLPFTSTGRDGCVGALYPLSGRVYMNTETAKLARTNVLNGSATLDVGIPNIWSWALQPQY